MSDTISDRLAAHGITHEAGHNSSRLVKFDGQTIGFLDAAGAVALLHALDSAALTNEVRK